MTSMERVSAVETDPGKWLEGWGRHIAQIDQTAYFGKPPERLREAKTMSVEAFDRAVAAMRPGATVGDVVDAAQVHGTKGCAAARLGMHGRGTGDDGPLVVAGRPNPTEVRDMMLEEGCCFAVKPPTSVEEAPDYCKWGDSVVVTRNGAERLGTRRQELSALS